MEIIDKVCVAYKLVEECQLRQFIEVLECGLDANRIVQDKGISLLHLAVGIEPIDLSNEFTKLLLHNGADPNIRSEDFMTPLHVAAAWGRFDAVRDLVSYGANASLVDFERKTPLDYAYEEEHWDIIDYLLQVSENHNRNDNTDESPTFHLELDKVYLKNRDIVAEYMKECDEVKSDSFELVEISKFNQCKIPEDVYLLENNINIFNESDNSKLLTKDIILTKDFQDDGPNDNYVNITMRRKAILDDDSSSSFKKRILNKFKRSRISRNSDDMHFRYSKSDNSNSMLDSRKYSGTTSTKDSSDGISYIAFSPTKENVQYSCFVVKSNSPRNIETKDSYVKSSSQSSPDQQKIIELSASSIESMPPPIQKKKNKLYPDLTELFEPKVPMSNNTFEVLVPDPSNPEITEDCSNRLNACILGNSHSSSSFKTAQSYINSFVDVSLEKFNPDLKTVDESRTSVEEEYKYTDEDEGIVLIERRLLVTPALLSSHNSLASEPTNQSKNGSSASSVPQIVNYDNQKLRQELTDYGVDVGPITDTTKRLYLKKLYRLNKATNISDKKFLVSKKKCYSVELEKTFCHPNWFKDLTFHSELEFKVALQFAQPDGKRKWREGNVKSSFTYLLLDPRVTDNLPCRAPTMEQAELWKTFINSIFYIGKGKRSRPYNHLYQAVAFWNKNLQSKSDRKINHILDIWESGLGVVCLHVFQNVIPVEAYTREAAMIDVLGLANLKNTQSGSYYGVAASWPMKERRKLGLYLLYRSMLIFLNEGERQLKPGDIGK